MAKMVTLIQLYSYMIHVLVFYKYLISLYSYVTAGADPGFFQGVSEG